MDDNIQYSSDLDTVLIKVASRCNINCTYCYVYNMGDDNWSRMEKLMSVDTIDAVVESLTALSRSQKRAFSMVLHGGEPFLIGAERLEYLLSSLRKSLPSDYPISLQTNGILISELLLDICSKYRTSVAVSLDGPVEVNDKYRVTHQNKGTFEKVVAGYEILKKHNDSEFLNAGLLAVIDPTSNPHEVYEFFKNNGAPSVDFLYKDGNHTILPTGKTSIDSIEYGRWMSELLDIYLSDPNPIPIRVLDDMIKVLLGGLGSKEGMGVTDFGILIIDTDGKLMKNDTLKSTYNGADQFAKPVNIKDGKLCEFLESEAFIAYRKLQRPVALKCLSCPILNVCGGGMILHRWKQENNFENPSVYCADQLYLVERIKTTLNIFNLI